MGLSLSKESNIIYIIIYRLFKERYCISYYLSNKKVSIKKLV